jgi:alkanesulfonate monooxygenase SsuD/methylene tetrahydromethanopterin reductase-like flavin-dependent oxidoreductase (luciferase family)
VKVSLCSIGEESTERWLEQVQLAEILGYHAFYHADEKWTRDGYTRLAAAAVTTKRLNLGISVADPYNRHPAFLAQMVGTLAEMAPERVMVAMATGSHFETLPGWEQVKPLAALREAIDLMRRLWSGERVTVDGKVIKFSDGQFHFTPKSIPSVWIASRGPKILALAGEIADKVLIGSFATPGGIEWAKQHVEVGLEKSGRRWDDVKLVSWLYTHVKDEADAPMPDNFRRGISHAFWSSRDALFARIDELSSDITDEFREFTRTAPHVWSPGVMADLRRLLPPGLFDTMSVIGTGDEVAAKLKALETAGVDEAILWPFAKDEGEDIEDVIAKISDRVLPQVTARPEREPYAWQD